MCTLTHQFVLSVSKEQNSLSTKCTLNLRLYHIRIRKETAFGNQTMTHERILAGSIVLTAEERDT